MSNIPRDFGEIPRSEFAEKLAKDPELAARTKKVEHLIREASRADIEAGIRSEQITQADLNITINSRAEDLGK